MAHDMWCTSEATLVRIMTLPQIRRAPLLHIIVNPNIMLRQQLKRLRIPKQEPRVSSILAHHSSRLLYHRFHHKLGVVLSEDDGLVLLEGLWFAFLRVVIDEHSVALGLNRVKFEYLVQAFYLVRNLLFVFHII